MIGFSWGGVFRGAETVWGVLLRLFLALVFLALVVAMLLLSVSMLRAQTNNCAPRDLIVERLFDGYGETRQSVGLGGGRNG